MKYSVLGSSGLSVSRVCLGSMTWGTQNNQADADQQIAYALDKGVNFIDTAEMYSIPPTAESAGQTERIIGDWLSRNSARRDELILATKIVGAGLPWIRDGSPISGETIEQAVDGSLQRLQIDTIDLYQLHWPNRPNPHFGRHWPGQVVASKADASAERADMLDMLKALKRCIDAGKIRYVGLSNETPWGLTQFMQLAREHQLPLVTSLQNEFNLACAKDYPYVLEQCVMDDVAYLPWSPLGGGVLSGKYLDGQRPDGSRWSMQARNGLFRDTEQMDRAVRAYIELAEQYSMTPSQLALLWVDAVDGVTSTIIGATTMAQLQENIEAFELDYSPELDAAVGALLRQHPVPF